MFNMTNSLGQDKQTDDVQFLKRKLKECYVAEGDTPRCAEIEKLLRAAINKIIKKEGIQSPGGFLPQVSIREPYSAAPYASVDSRSLLRQQQEAQIYQNLQANGMTPDSQYSWNKGLAPAATQGVRPSLPTLPFGSLFSQSMTASPLSMAPAVASYGNYSGT